MTETQDENRQDGQTELTAGDTVQNVENAQAEQSAQADRSPARHSHKIRPRAAVLYVSAILLTILLVLAFKNNWISLRIGRLYIGRDSHSIGVQAMNKLNTLENTLSDFYFDKPSAEDSVEGIAKGYVDSYGDPYTVYYTPEEYAAFMQSSEGVSEGIGVIVGKTSDGSLLISRVIEGAPAAESDLQAGDLILAVDGQSVLDEDISDTVERIRGEDGTSVVLTVSRDGKTFETSVERGKYEVPLVSYRMLEGNVGYLYLAEFDASAKQQFLSAYHELLGEDGASSLIIDLRGDPGGLLDVDTDILDEILPDGDIVSVRMKDGTQEVVTGTNPDQIDVPLVVLVNGQTASAAELFAAAVQDYGVGTIIGTQTFGKGIAQVIKELPDGSGVKYTIEKYFTPNGRDIHEIGVTPDMVVETEDGGTQDSDPQTDTQLRAALEFLAEQDAQ